MGETSNKGVALVTGADGGMGRIHTRELAKAGYEVIMACIDTDAARPVMEEIQRAVLFISCVWISATFPTLSVSLTR